MLFLYLFLCPITCQILTMCLNCIFFSFVYVLLFFFACSSRASPCPHPKRSRHVAGGPQTWAQAPWDDGRLQTSRRASAGVLRKNCKRLWINYIVSVGGDSFSLGQLFFRNLHCMYVTMFKCFYCFILIYIGSSCWPPLFFFLQQKKDPAQFLQVHGRAYKIHLDPAVALAAESPINMWGGKTIHVITHSSVCGRILARMDLFILSKRMPWQGDVNNMIDRFDVRAHLDYIPTYTPPLLNTP